MKPTLVQLILNATAAGKSMLLAANAAAQKELLSLGNVDNTSDEDKPVSTAQQTAINAKIGGSVGTTANRLAKSSGTDGLTLQASGITVDASENISGVGTVGCGTLTTTGDLITPGAASFSNNGVRCGGLNVGRGANVGVAGDQINVWSNFVRKISFVGGAMNAASDFAINVRNNVSNLSGVTDCSLLRNGAGQWATLSDSGLAVRNLANSADAAITGSAITASGLMCAGIYTVGTLPSAAANASKFASVTDSSVTTFRSIVAGGGANRVMVFSDGTNWLVI